MTNIRLFSVIAVSVVTTALVIGAISRPAHADTPRTMECMPAVSTMVADTAANEAKAKASQIEWANGQIAAGRTSFTTMPLAGFNPNGPVPIAFCAW